MIVKALSGATALLLVLTVFLWMQLGKAKKEIGSLEASVEVAVAANGSNVDTISELKALINSMIKKRAAEKKAADNAIAEKEAEVKQARISRAKTEKEINEILNKTKGCKSIATARLNDLCPDIVNRLRLKAEGSHQNTDN